MGIKDRFSKYELLLLSQVKGLGISRLNQVLSLSFSFEELLAWSPMDWAQIKGVRPGEIHEDFQKKRLDKQLCQCIKDTLLFSDAVFSFWDKEYPSSLKHIQNPPVMLFGKGNYKLLETQKIAMVGTRDMTDYGKIVTQSILSGLSGQNVTIVSGLARGIDAVAHEEALRNNLGTIAVLGTGLNLIYPSENNKLYMRILEQKGLILSEFLLHTKPNARNFPKRNRIISGLSDAVLVVEAGIKSGAVITAEFALEQGKDVYAVPGEITSLRSEGCNKLIKDGAFVYTTFKDITERLGLDASLLKEDTQTNKKEMYSIEEKKLLSVLDLKGTSVDKIAQMSGISVQKVLVLLFHLEFKGVVWNVQGQVYARKIVEKK